MPRLTDQELEKNISNLMFRAEEIEYVVNKNYNSLDTATNYDRYLATVYISHEALKSRPYLMEMEKYKDIKNPSKSTRKYCSLNNKILNFLAALMLENNKVKLAKKGKVDKNLTIKEKQQALSNSLRIVEKSLLNYKKDCYSKLIIKSFSELNNDEILKILEKTNMNYLDNDQIRYILLEQALLAPIKLREYIDKNKASFKSQNHEKIKSGSKRAFMHLYSLNSSTDKFNEFENQYDKYVKEEKSFFKIGRNQVISYCMTVLHEFFDLGEKDIHHFYYSFYSDAKIESTTNFAKNTFEYIHKEENGFHEHLPYLVNDFQDIFYDIITKDEI